MHLKKLKEERSTYLEFRKIQRELEHLSKLWLAYKFISAAKKASEKLDEEDEKVEQDLKTKEEIIKQGEVENG